MNGLKSRVSQVYLGICLAGGLVHSTATHLTHTHKNTRFFLNKKTSKKGRKKIYIPRWMPNS